MTMNSFSISRICRPRNNIKTWICTYLRWSVDFKKIRTPDDSASHHLCGGFRRKNRKKTKQFSYQHQKSFQKASYVFWKTSGKLWNQFKKNNCHFSDFEKSNLGVGSLSRFPIIWIWMQKTRNLFRTENEFERFCHISTLRSPKQYPNTNVHMFALDLQFHKKSGPRG